MECNHLYNFSDIGIFCDYCFEHFAIEINGVNYWITKKENIKSEIQNEFSAAKYGTLDSFIKIIQNIKLQEQESKAIDESNINNNGFIGLPKSFENKSSGIDQHVIINNQINKITELKSEVKRLQKIIIGLSERLVNENKVI